MRFLSVGLGDYRNIELARLDLDSPRVFICGPNGQGKTNLLEALGYATSLQAFRTRENASVIRFGQDFSQIVYQIEHEDLGESEATVRIKKTGKEVSIDGEKIRRVSEFTGRFPTALMSSKDMRLADGSPSLRRRFLDSFLCGIDRSYFTALQVFQKALKERNALLKKGADQAFLSAFEKQMAQPAKIIVDARERGIRDLLTFAKVCHQRISDSEDEVAIEYKPSVTLDSETTYLDVFEQNKEKDRVLRTTSRGPHRDDFRIRLNGQLAGEFASEGQQRSIVLALSFAIVAYWRERFGFAPVILADDTLSELDPRRRQRFWESIDSDLQVIATGTEFPNGEERGDWLVYEANNGTYTKS